MFILSKEIIKEITNLLKYWEESVKDDNPSHALAIDIICFGISIPLIIILLNTFVLDIILYLLKDMIVKKRSYNERNK
jgi:hypothetical protein